MSGLDVYRAFLRLRARLFTLAIRRGFREIGNGTVIMPPLRVSGEARIRIGNRGFVGPNCWFQVLREPSGESTQTVITIGDRAAFAGYCTISAVESVVIEDSVLIARYVYIADHSHRYEDPLKAIRDQGVDKVAPVRILGGAWLGQGVVVCPGVTIGRNAVIGANSVVTADVPHWSVAVGAPARVVRSMVGARPG